MTSVRFRARISTLLLAAALLAPAALAYAQAPAKARRPPAKGQTKASSAAFDAAVKLGDEARLAGRLDEALAQYARALQARPTWADGWWNVGAILYQGDRYAEARDAFRNVIGLDPKRGHAWGMLGLCEFQTREYERAGVSLKRGRAL